jgi:hypothetical protein
VADHISSWDSPFRSLQAEAVVHQLTNKAASGDPRARREYFQVHKMLQPPESTEEIAPDLSDRDKNVMQNILQSASLIF